MLSASPACACLLVQDAETDLARIVGFEVEPYSVQHKYEGELHLCMPNRWQGVQAGRRVQHSRRWKRRHAGCAEVQRDCSCSCLRHKAQRLAPLGILLACPPTHHQQQRTSPTPLRPSGKWDAESTTLTTCDPDDKKHLSDKGPHQVSLPAAANHARPRVTARQ